MSVCVSVCARVSVCVRVSVYVWVRVCTFVCALRIPLGSKSVVIAFVSAGLCTNKRQTDAGAWECESLGAALSLAHFRGALPFSATPGSNWWMETGGVGGESGGVVVVVLNVQIITSLQVFDGLCVHQGYILMGRIIYCWIYWSMYLLIFVVEKVVKFNQKYWYPPSKNPICVTSNYKM